MKGFLFLKQKGVQVLGSVLCMALLLSSNVVLAQSRGSGGPGRCPSTISAVPADFNEFICLIGGIANSLLPIVMAMTLLAFFFGLAMFIRNAGDPKEIQKGKDIMKWGIVALFVMVSFVAIINVFTGDFFGGRYGIPQFPETP